MALTVETVALRYLNVSADTAIPVPIPTFQEEDVYVFYGKDGLTAVQGTDYTVALNDTDFSTVSVTPLAALITKIDALIAADSDEVNAITVRRILDYTTEATAAGVRETTFTSREIERAVMRDQQLRDGEDRALRLSRSFASPYPDVEIKSVPSDASNEPALVFLSDGGIGAGPTTLDLQNAGDNATAAAASAAAASGQATAAAASAEAAAASAAVYGPNLQAINNIDLTGGVAKFLYVNAGEDGFELGMTRALGRSVLAGATMADIEDLLIRPGTVRQFFHDVAAGEPADWTRADGSKVWLRVGSVVSRTVYADLFALYGTNWGAGDGSTTFQLPGVRGAFYREWDFDTTGGTAWGIDPETRALHDYQGDELRSHSHSYQSYDLVGNRELDNNAGAGSLQNKTTGAAGGAETRPKNALITTYIKT